MVRIAAVIAALALLAGCQTETASAPQATVSTQNTNDTRIAKQLFGAARVASAQAPDAIGGYALGCQAGAVQLPETGPTWQAMRLSRNRNWAQPITVDYVQDLSRKVANLPGWEGLYIGDMSQPRGGPMLTGHRSHQSGLDVDIWMLPPDRLNLTAQERENISSISMRRASGAYTNDRWTPQHEAVLKAAASDPRVARIFVFPGAKVAMCNSATGDRSWLNKIRPWWGHHYHFHVRLKCPAGDSGCVDQAPPPPGDGCADAQTWVNNILNPPPPDPNATPAAPRREITVGRLPAQCAAVLAAN
ncbi:penicillin-insensitive murein endopeptidase [Yoonia sp. R2331]|uniref:penicillin-insensitive murein endopeptidase n=1 Tax=Yoonia sp. R2331 TaxID=3237238 RepID=UPI0034E50779